MAKKQKVPVLSKPSPLFHSPFAELGVDGHRENTLKNLEPFEEALAKITDRLILRKEKAHRAGKTVLIVEGFSTKITEQVIQILAKEAKIACGCGGTVNDRKIELQGNQPERVRKFFESKGFGVAGFR